MATRKRTTTRKLAPSIKKAAEQLEQKRAVAKTAARSRQPRFVDNEDDAHRFFDQIFNFVKKPFMEAPPAKSGDSRSRDEWMSDIILQQESHLAGVTASAALINANRGWSITGGRNQVYRFAPVLFNAEGGGDGGGWRNYVEKQSWGFYTSKLGAPTEVATMGLDDPAVAGIYNIDPTRCVLTGSASEPLEYEPRASGRGLGKALNSSRLLRFQPQDYFRVVSMPSPYEKLGGLGYPAVERALQLAQLMCAIYQHDRETLGAAPPTGYLALNGLTMEQWKAANKARKENRENAGQSLYRDIVVLASPQSNIDLKFITLSKLPDQFNMLGWVQMLMQGYALCFGYDPNEFYSIRSGAALGIAQQSMIQSQKATAKGELDFVLAWQDQFRRWLPKTIHFEWDERSDEGDRIQAETQEMQVKLVDRMYQSGLIQGDPLISRDEARKLLARSGVIPREWVGDDDDEMTDVGEVRKRARDLEEVWWAAAEMPDDPIVRIDHVGREMILWQSGEAFMQQRKHFYFPVERQALLTE